MLATWLLSATIALAPRLPLAVEPVAGGGTEEEFEAALALVDRMIAADNAKKAKELLMTTIEESQGKPWALYHLTEIVDDLRRATFWSANEKPDPKTLVSGELLSWSASSGQIKVRYRPDSNPVKIRTFGKKAPEGKKDLPAALYDFEKSGKTLIHPIAFEGPYTIEIEGDAYPPLATPPAPPGLIVCSNWERSSVVSFGSPPMRTTQESRYVPPRILTVDGGEVTTEAEGGMDDAPWGEFELKVVVSSSAITVFSSGKKILTAKKPSSVYGRIAFLNLPTVREIRISGKAQPSWLQGVVDTGIQDRWTAFEKEYKPIADLPAWLRAKAWGSAGGVVWTNDSTPGSAEPSDTEHVRGFFDVLEKKGATEALESTKQPPVEGLREELRSWLTALALRALGRDDEALASCSKVCSADPRFLPARRMKVELRLDVGSTGEALEDCKGVVADFPSEPKPYFDLALIELLQGRPEEARTALRKAIDDGVPAGTLEDAEHLVVRAIRGPLWSRAFEYKTQNYAVRSDIDQATCFEAANLLEKFYAKFNIHLRRIPGLEKKMFRVYLFSGEKGYLAYGRDLFGRDRTNTAGLYSPVVKQLLIWNLPDAEQMMRTVRHEGFHQYFDRLVGASPTWLNEGLAEYYEGSKLVRGAWSDGEINAGHMETLAEKHLIPLEDFLKIQPGAFYDPEIVELCYAEAWGFVHFLQNGGKDPKKRFDALLDALIAGAKPRDAVAQVFDAASVPKIEKDFLAYLAKLK